MSVAVVGAGIAGLRLCEALRQLGYAAPITMIGDEAHPPYSRPPLSKAALRDAAEEQTIWLHQPPTLDDLDIDLRLGVTVRGLDVAERSVGLDGEVVRADHVVIATGAEPRRLPGIDGRNVLMLRTLDDAIALRGRLMPGAAVVVIGAGFVGLEVAAAAVARGCEVTVVDIAPTPLERAFAPEVGSAVRALHESHGVSFRMGTGVSAVSAGDEVKELESTDGSRLRTDVVVVGVGVRPATGWLTSSGLTLDDGVGCDATLQAAPGIWAIGDVCRWPDRNGNTRRIEHWTNAAEQAAAVAAAIVTGATTMFDPVPYFWSDQYDAKLQSIGAARGDETVVVRGALDEPKWVALVRQGDRLGGVIGLRSAGQVMRRMPLLAQRISWAEALEQS